MADEECSYRCNCPSVHMLSMGGSVKRHENAFAAFPYARESICVHVKFASMYVQMHVHVKM